MKKAFFFLLLITTLGYTQTSLPLIPHPKEIELGSGNFTINKSTFFLVKDKNNNEVALFNTFMFTKYGYECWMVDYPGYGKSSGELTQEMMEKLNLTADQKEKMKSINQEFKKQMDEFKEQQMTDDDRRGKRMELMMARKEKISAVLTADQRKQWEEMKEQRGGGRGMRKADK